MTAARFLDVAPLGRLMASRRAVRSWLGGLPLAFGLMSLGVSQAVERANESRSHESFLQLCASLILLALPASLGLLVSDASFEVLRRPTTYLLPGLRRRLRRSALVVAMLAAVLSALVLAPLRPEWTWLGAFAIAMLGFTVGVWLVARLGGEGIWRLHVGALAGFSALVGLALQADPLWETFTTHALLAGAAVLLALMLISLRFHPTLLRIHLFSPSATTFAPQDAVRKTPSPKRAGNPELLCPSRLGGSLAGWIAASWFERRTTSPVWGPIGFLCFVAYTYVLALIGPSLMTLLDHSGSLLERARTLPATFMALVVGLPRSASDIELKGTGVFFVTFGVFAGIAASLSSAPLRGSFLYPVSRKMRARLAYALGVRVTLQTAALTLGLGAVLGGILALATGQAWPRALPSFAWIALANLLLGPWILIASHASRPAWGDRLGPAGVLARLALLITVLIGLGELRSAMGGLVAEHSSTLWLLLYVSAWAASLVALRSYLLSSYPRRDLVHRQA